MAFVIPRTLILNQNLKECKETLTLFPYTLAYTVYVHRYMMLDKVVFEYIPVRVRIYICIRTYV